MRDPLCPFCYAGTHPLPFTPDDLRWYFGESEGAMGLRSSQGAIEAMLAAGPPPLGGQANSAENRMLRVVSFPGERDDKGKLKVDPVARHRCIRNHRLSGLETRLTAILRAAYDGEDWTRMLDERAGKGARLELQKLFPHEVLQIAPFTRIVQRGLVPKKAAPTPTKAVYRDGSELLSSVRLALSLPEDATTREIRGRLRDLGTYFRKATPPSWGEVVATIEALRGATGERGEARQVLQAARERVSLGLKLAGENELAFVVGEAKKSPPPPTAQSYLLKLLAGGKHMVLWKVRKEAEGMLREAHAAARVELPQHVSRPRKARSTPLSEVAVLPSEVSE